MYVIFNFFKELVRKISVCAETVSRQCRNLWACLVHLHLVNAYS